MNLLEETYHWIYLVFFDLGKMRPMIFQLFFSQPIWSFGGGLKITVPLFGQLSFGYGWDKNLEGNFWIGLGQVF